MKSIETIVTVSPDGKFTVQLPPDIPAGEHQAIIVIDEIPLQETLKDKERIKTLKFSAYPVGLSDQKFTFRREDLYADG
ncbi:MAG TPA: hypothetical protein VK203_01065 [Nostocaceae cyanobacterium]|nr:hypothetical protein [Nostocaceae cyanobacterium]